MVFDEPLNSKDTKHTARMYNSTTPDFDDHYSSGFSSSGAG